MIGHAYNPNCGCPGCQFQWAAEETLRKLGPTLKIGEFTPTAGDIAEDPRFPGFFRAWCDGEWWPKLLVGEPVCVCASPDQHSNYGCRVDDSELPTPPAIDQAEAMRRRKAR